VVAVPIHGKKIKQIQQNLTVAEPVPALCGWGGVYRAHVQAAAAAALSLLAARDPVVQDSTRYLGGLEALVALLTSESSRVAEAARWVAGGRWGEGEVGAGMGSLGEGVGSGGMGGETRVEGGGGAGGAYC
jgi:hypothetical protein